VAVRASVVLKESGASVPWAVRDWEFFDLPDEGEAYWHRRWAVRVEGVEPGEPPRVHLAFDWERDKRYHAQLPGDAYVIEAWRDSHGGMWEARVVNTVAGKVVSEAEAEGCDGAVQAALARVAA
jgi:hypothetical protein